MKKKTTSSVAKMKKLVIDFLEIANSIDDAEWIEVIKSIRQEKERLNKIQFGIELGNVFIMLFFLNEIFESLLQKEGISQNES